MIQGTEAMDQPVRRAGGSLRKLLIVVGLVALVALGSVVYPSVRRWLAAERSVDLERVRLGRVVRGDLERDVSVQGHTVAAFHPTTFSPAGGIVKLEVREGDVVEAGRVLARVDSPELDSALEQERSSVASLEAQLERQCILASRTLLSNRQEVDLARVELEAARRAMDRAERSRADGILNAVEYETAQDDLRRAELELEHALQDADLEKETLDVEMRNRELELERQRLVVVELERQVAELTIRAPVAGLVSRVEVEDRDAVLPNQPLITVVDLSAFEVEIRIPQAYADEVGPGTRALVHVAGESLPGRVKSVAPEVEGNQVQGIVAFDGAAPEGLRQNQRVSQGAARAVPRGRRRARGLRGARQPRRA
jgi:HlyD family secretion protein